MNSDQKFPCTMCGACCRQAGNLKLLCEEKNIDLGFNVPINDDGSCGHLIPIVRPDGVDGFGCAIYDDRPNICKINMSIPVGVETKDHFRVSARSCRDLQVFYGIPDTYRVQIE